MGGKSAAREKETVHYKLECPLFTKRIILLLFLMLCISQMQSKELYIHTKGKKLNVLLNELAAKNDLLISFDDASMAAINLPKGKNFQDVSALFDYLKKYHYVKVDTIGNSLVLSVIMQKNYTYHGKVYDVRSGEALSNAEIICEDFHTYTSEQGYFTFLSPTNGTKSITVRHLGYNILDTLIASKAIAAIGLQGHVEHIGNVIVSKSLKSHNVNIGNRSGYLKLTPEFISKLPGYGESSMYAFLKLMPGVLATGESVNDMSLRGSSEGQNLYIFDHYRVYNPWYKLNGIGTINPLLVKDIEVYKSGIDASGGENVGGVVLIKGIEAIPEDVQGEIFVNNFVGNAVLEIPLNDKMALVTSMRKNIKEELKIPDAVGEYTIKNTFDGFADNYQVNISPKYNLYDGNFKFIYKINAKSILFASGFASFEKNRLDATTLTDEFRLRNRQMLSNRQYAGSLHFSNYNENGKQLDITAAYSSINTGLDGLANVMRLDKEKPEVYLISNESSSFLQEIRLKAKYRLPFRKGGFIEYGLGFTTSNIDETKLPKAAKWQHKVWHQLGYGFVNTQFTLSPRWSANLGSRINYSAAVKKLFAEPRLAINYYPDNYWKMYASYGIFQQFVYNTNVLDELKNVQYRRVSVKGNIPVFQLNDACLGVRYSRNAWTLSAEFFHKYTDKRIRATYAELLFSADKAKLTTEKVRYSGGDFFAKYQNKGFISWLSFTLSDYSIHSPKNHDKAKSEAKTNVHDGKILSKQLSFSNRDIAYRHSQYDMRQELKCAVAYTWKNLTISASYVYGSGFKMWHQPSSVGAPDYSRFDIGAFYKLQLFATHAELGFSVLNVLDRKNKKLDEFSRFGVGDDIVSYNTYGLKLTPAFFVKIKF